jgi:propanol-preferring alcohol dehydrogenase
LTTSKPAGSSSAPNFATDGAWSAITLLAPSTIGEPMAWSDQRAIDLRYGRPVLALQLHKSAAPEASPLALVELAEPGPAAGELVLDVAACAVCRTDLQLVEGDLEARRLPIVPGHQAVGRVHQLGQDVAGWEVGERAGVAWLASTCGECQYCLTSRENLCPRARFTGWDRDGGYATRIVVRADFALRIPDGFDDLAAAPLLCGGVIGYRSLKGAKSAAAYDETIPPLDAAVTFAPSGDVVVAALRSVARGATVAINAIHLDRIPEFSYDLLWLERSLRSVANFTRTDARELLELASTIPLRTAIETFPLADGNKALQRLAAGELDATAVLTTGPG